MTSFLRYNDSPRAGWSGDRIPMGARFSAPVQTGPGAHPDSCIMGTGSLPGVKRPGRGADHPPASSADVKERAELYLYSTYGPSWSVIGWPLPLIMTSFLAQKMTSQNVTLRPHHNDHEDDDDDDGVAYRSDIQQPPWH